MANVLYRLFEQRCLKMMDSMYEEDSKHAIDLMDNEAVVWGIHSSPLTFAYENFMYDIVAHTCSQKYINKKWYNELAPDLNPFFKVNMFLIKYGLGTNEFNIILRVAFFYNSTSIHLFTGSLNTNVQIINCYIQM